ncbi:MAG: Bax inhibitor-1/YccA family protein [Lachnospiraceae bacterium]|nr:Bax inhibitor-1/YccA family protein [Lachnospiraceae bacterium]
MDNNNNYRDFEKLGGNANLEQQMSQAQNDARFAYQQDFNGYNNNGNGMNGTYRAGGTTGGIQGAFGEALEVMQQKVVAQSFIFMLAALGITAIGAMVASDVLLEWFIQNPANLIILLVAEIAVVIISNIALKKNNVVLSASLMTIYSFINGATIGIVCMGYVDTSVTKVFIITAVMFGVTAFYGLVSKKDLSSVGSICIMGLIGLILVGVVNIFLKSEGLDYLTSFIGVAVFVGLTAYDTQKIKDHTACADSTNTTALALRGAFELYLDFINLFLYLLRLFGKRR